jgi:hypothetical protein
MKNMEENSVFSGLSKEDKKLVKFLVFGLLFIAAAAISFGFNLFPEIISGLLGGVGVILLLHFVYFSIKAGGSYGE